MADKACLVLGTETTIGFPANQLCLCFHSLVLLFVCVHLSSLSPVPLLITTLCYFSLIFVNLASLGVLVCPISVHFMFRPWLLACPLPTCIPAVSWVCILHPFLLCVPATASSSSSPLFPQLLCWLWLVFLCFTVSPSLTLLKSLVGNALQNSVTAWPLGPMSHFEITRMVLIHSTLGGLRYPTQGTLCDFSWYISDTIKNTVVIALICHLSSLFCPDHWLFTRLCKSCTRGSFAKLSNLSTMIHPSHSSLPFHTSSLSPLLCHLFSYCHLSSHSAFCAFLTVLWVRLISWCYSVCATGLSTALLPPVPCNLSASPPLHIHAHTHVHTFTQTHTHTHAHAHTCTHTHTHTHTNTHVVPM